MDYLLIARETSTDPRDAAASFDRTLGYNTDGEALKTVAARLTEISVSSQKEFYRDYDHNMTHEQREEKVKKALCVLRQYDSTFSFGGVITAYYVRERELAGNSIPLYNGDLFDV